MPAASYTIIKQTFFINIRLQAVNQSIVMNYELCNLCGCHAKSYNIQHNILSSQVPHFFQIPFLHFEVDRKIANNLKPPTFCKVTSTISMTDIEGKVTNQIRQKSKACRTV